MRVLISALDDENYDVKLEVSQLNYTPADNNFWMPLLMGDDWLQRVNSSHILKIRPCIVRIEDKIGFIVFSNRSDADQFHAWLIAAEEQVREGFRTMRG